MPARGPAGASASSQKQHASECGRAAARRRSASVPRALLFLVGGRRGPRARRRAVERRIGANARLPPLPLRPSCSHSLRLRSPPQPAYLFAYVSPGSISSNIAHPLPSMPFSDSPRTINPQPYPLLSLSPACLLLETHAAVTPCPPPFFVSPCPPESARQCVVRVLDADLRSGSFRASPRNGWAWVQSLFDSRRVPPGHGDRMPPSNARPLRPEPPSSFAPDPLGYISKLPVASQVGLPSSGSSGPGR